MTKSRNISWKASAAVVVAVCLTAIGCARLPEKLVSPTLKIETTIVDNKEAYRLTLNTGLQNENNGTALLNVKGIVFFRDSASKSPRVMTLPFEVPVILPFDTGLVDIEKTFSGNEIMPLLNLLGSDREKMQAEKTLERSFMDDGTVGFEITAYDKKDIIKLLEDSLNEKNK
jgi:hypothetical protein